MLSSITGKELSRIYMLLEKSICELVSRSPELSLERVKRAFGVANYSINGRELFGVSKIRDELYAIGAGMSINALTITAPHTHWTKGPVVYHFQNPSNRYIIGPHKVVENGRYLPVSFVFSAGGLIPYEWADDSILIDPEEHNKTILTLNLLSDRISYLQLPLGIAIEFRFKKSIYETSVDSFEVPISDVSDSFNGFSQIISDLARTDAGTLVDVEQVSWHCSSDLNLGLHTDEIDLLTHLTAHFTESGLSETVFLQQLQQKSELDGSH